MQSTASGWQPCSAIGAGQNTARAAPLVAFEDGAAHLRSGCCAMTSVFSYA
jgi:hypothetical protein